MEDGLYHFEVYWNEKIQKQIDVVLNSGLPLRFDAHAIENKFKRKISTDRITIEKLKKGYCFEAEVKKDKVVKFVIRYNYNVTYDLATVWRPRADCLYCVTVWLNESHDKHYTLDSNKYVIGKIDEKNEQHISLGLGDVINQQIKNK